MTPILFVALPNHISSADRMQRRNGLHAIILALKPCITRFLHSAWIVLAGFADGMPIQIRVMPDCIVIPHNTRELYGYAEEMSVAYVNRQKIKL
ncbi:SymE family type I addiction module toxin [Cronobacter turicensis]|uniref:SymE family type I addiction module toxin n=1 Tax=Cronobacter turicensis TaxID=413502 RepID=UPI0024AF2958|nr:SymE family type I addiction module toxin [Cronobacter turicensis]MDI7407441.1 SymE family type I addiction module toxin [Cronobacter turicensis]MDI7419687.1 SymE family type I addiction module toxin [Cronobacter turicensis]MDI7495610.1 SymE family type I addiction module toxin [Cronobacter turicensis]